MNAYASKVFLLVVFVAAGVCFVLFNILRVKEERALLRYLFYLPLLIAYIPFYLTKSLDS